MANEDNFSIIAQRWPRMAEMLAGLSSTAFEVDESGAVPSIVLQGLHLNSCFDPVAEAEQQALLIPEDAVEAWVYGVGVGILPQVLLQRPALKALNIVVFNHALFKATLESLDYVGWLSDERVNLLSATDMKDVQQPFCAVPPCLKLADDGSAVLRDRVILELESQHINNRFRTNPVTARQIEANELYVQSDAGVTDLFGHHTGGNAVVLAAGPSLGWNIERLADLKQRGALVIAVDAVLHLLREHKIRPDYVVSIDENPLGVDALFAGDLSFFNDVPLVYFPVVSSQALEKWPGPRYVAFSASPVYENMMARYPTKGVLFVSGSVLHAAVDLAVRLGCKRVQLLGTDFCYPNNRSHAEGVAHAQTVSSSAIGDWVLNGRGDKVATSRNLRGYLRDLERYIEANPDIEFVNSSRDGALIEGTSYDDE